MELIRGFSQLLRKQNVPNTSDGQISSTTATWDREHDFRLLRLRLESHINRSKKTPSTQNSIFTSTIDWTGLLAPDDDRFIGGGSFGDVYHGKWKKMPTVMLPEVVIKVIRVPPVNSRQAEKRSRQLQREITVWHLLYHPNIVPFLGIAFTRGEYPSLISLWMPNGTVREFLFKNPHIPRMGLIKGVGNGLAYLHTFQPPIMHGDLKGDNVLVNKNGVPCLVDFGLSRMMEDQTLWATSATSAPGTTRWKAPELLCGDQPTVTPESDVYAFGITCVEIFTNSTPYPLYRNDAAVVTAVYVKGERPAKPFGLDDTHWHLWTTCWTSDPSTRPSMLDVMYHFDLLEPPPTSTFDDTASDETVSQMSLGLQIQRPPAPGPQLRYVEDHVFGISALESEMIMTPPDEVEGPNSKTDLEAEVTPYLYRPKNLPRSRKELLLDVQRGVTRVTREPTSYLEDGFTRSSRRNSTHSMESSVEAIANKSDQNLPDYENITDEEASHLPPYSESGYHYGIAV